VQPLYHGLKTVVSAAAHLPAQVVAVTRDVVHDTLRVAQAVYQRAVQTAGDVVQTVSKAAQAALPTLAGIAAGVLTGAACEIATFGAGSAGCVVAGFAAAGAVTSALNCPPGHSIAGCAARGAIAGAVGGAVFVASGGTAGGVSAAIIAGGVSQAASAATEQVITTGSIDATAVVEQGVAGAATAGLFHGAGRLASGLRSSEPRLAACPANSFVAGTPVLLASGAHRPIEEVQPGDEVVATDPTTGRTEARPVTGVIVGQGQKQLVEITVGDGGGTITATDGHPFWLPGQHRWAEAKDLRPGDLLRTAAGTSVQVRAVREFAQVLRSSTSRSAASTRSTSWREARTSWSTTAGPSPRLGAGKESSRDARDVSARSGNRVDRLEVRRRHDPGGHPEPASRGPESRRLNGHRQPLAPRRFRSRVVGTVTDAGASPAPPVGEDLDQRRRARDHPPNARGSLRWHGIPVVHRV